MTTSATPLTTEQKVLLAIQESNQVVSAFSPVAGTIVAAGVQAEPIVSGLVHMIQGLFKHHTGSALHPAQAKVDITPLTKLLPQAETLAAAIAKAQAGAKK
jgi:hypothetical protein